MLKLPNPYFGSINYSYDAGVSDSNYASLMMSKRIVELAITGIFTLGKATDDNSSFGTGAANSGNIVNARIRAASTVSRILASAIASQLTVHFIVPDLWGGGAQIQGVRRVAYGGDRYPPGRAAFLGLLFCSFKPVYQVPGDSSTPVVANAGCDYNARWLRLRFPEPTCSREHLSAAEARFSTGLFTASQFPAPPLGQEGNLGRNTFSGPGLVNFNTEFAKASNIPWFTHEGASFEFRADIFNLFNRVNLGCP